MELFKIFGTLALKGKDAFNDDVDEATSKGKKLANAVGKGLSSAAKVGAQAIGFTAKASAAAVGAAATAIGTITKKSLDYYGEYEQLVGGIQAAFGETNFEALNKVFSTAETAWKDLTMSENEYFDSFMGAYPLIKASIDDENAAIEQTNRLLTLESDLANTFGYDTSEAANAINWALKGTYSYLDNLNIGIQGTAEGFLEAANNSGLFDKNLESLDELTSADKISVIEHYAAQYGVLGRTANEAAETVQGSVKMMKAAWQNLLTQLGANNDETPLDYYIDNFVDSVDIAAKNIMPRITHIFSGIGSLVTKLAPTIATAIPALLTEFALPLLEAGAQMIQSIAQGIQQNIGAVVDGASEIISVLLTTLLEVMPTLMAAGIQVIQSLLDGILQNIDAVTSGAVTIILMLTNALITNLPTIIQVGVQILVALINGLAQAAPQLVPVIMQAVVTIIATLISSIPQLLSAGISLIGGLSDGLMTGFTQLFPKVGGWIEQNIYAPIKEKVSGLLQIGGELASKLWEGIKNGLTNLFPGLAPIINGLSGDAVAAASSTFQGLTPVATSAATEATTAAANIVLESGDLVPADARNPVSAMGEAMAQDTSMEEAGQTAVTDTGTEMQTAVESAGFDVAGQTAMQKFVDGINAMAGTVTAAVSAIASQAVAQMQSALDQIQAMAASATPPGFATGLNYVPYDNFPALLHKGEAVLTAEEATTWRAGKSAAGENTGASTEKVVSKAAPSAPQEIITNITLELDGAVLARQLFRHNKVVNNDRGLSFVKG